MNVSATSTPVGASTFAAAPPIALTIDGTRVTVPVGTSIWDAAREAGIEVPVLCHDPRLRPVGVCRMCVVEVKGARTLQASCVRPCEAGMEVSTKSPLVERNRSMLTELLLSDHPTPCARETSTGDCDLEALGRGFGLLSTRDGAPSSNGHAHPHAHAAKGSRFAPQNGRAKDPSSQVIAVDHQACILCDRCIRACDELQNNDVIGRTGKGYEARIAFDLDAPMGDSTCVACGECAAVCPTGALVNQVLTIPTTPVKALKAVDSVCPYCGVGCALTYHVDEARNSIVFAEGRESPASQGRLCDPASGAGDAGSLDSRTRHGALEGSTGRTAPRRAGRRAMG